MKLDIKELTQKLIDLDKKIQELDAILINSRIEINEIFWEIINIKKQNPNVQS